MRIDNPVLTIPVSGDLSNCTFPTLNQNTTGTASNVTGVVAVANGGTGSTTAPDALTALGAYPDNNPDGFTTNTGTVTSVGGTGTVNGISLSGTVTSSGSLTLGGTLDLSSPPAIGGNTPNTIKGTVIQATNGIIVNSKTVSASYSIASGDCGMSVGPVTVASGQTVTVASGSRWVVL